MTRIDFITPNASRGHVIGVHMYVYMYVCDPPKILNGILVVNSPFQILKVTLSLHAPEMLSPMSKSRLSLLNAHLFFCVCV